MVVVDLPASCFENETIPSEPPRPTIRSIQPWCRLVLAACDGEGALAGVLGNNKSATSVTERPSTTKGAGAYLTALAVEGFRGIGPGQALTLTVSPGLAIIVGRNSSGSPASPKHWKC